MCVCVCVSCFEIKDYFVYVNILKQFTSIIFIVVFVPYNGYVNYFYLIIVICLHTVIWFQVPIVIVN